jgi:hypothetical protein
MAPLADFVARIPGFSGWSHPDKFKWFTWYMLRKDGRAVVTLADIKKLYAELHLQPSPNPALVVSRLAAKSPREVLIDGQAFRLERRVLESLDRRYGELLTPAPVELGEAVVPISAVANTKTYFMEIAKQINGTYRFEMFDCCAVMCRRLIESLLIEGFLATGEGDRIKQNGEFMMLSGILSVTNSKQFIKLSRGSDKALEQIKDIGDRAAHHRSHLSSRQDIDVIAPKLRALVTELLHVAKLK